MVEVRPPRSRQQRRAAARFRKKSQLAAFGALGAAAAAVPAGAAVVTTLLDSGPGSLRQAVLDTNGSADDVITFQAGLTGTILLDSQLEITDDLEIQGPGAAVLAVSGQDASRVFYLYNAAAAPISIEIEGLTVTAGNATNANYGGNAYGGGIVNWSETLVVRDCVITDNESEVDGGGIAVQTGGTLELVDSVVSDNDAINGGGVYLESIASSLTVRRSTIDGNDATSSGGGIMSESGDVSLYESTLSRNTSYNPGSALRLDNDEAYLLAVNVTISGNISTYNAGSGAAVTLGDGADGLLRHVTIVGNDSPNGSCGGVALPPDADLTIENSILADNTGETSDCDLTVSLGASAAVSFSLVENSTGFTDNGGNITGVGPDLGPLQANGGPTETHLPNGSSQALEAGDPAFVPPPSIDQRGLPREINRLDMGAVELQQGVLEVPALGGLGAGLLGAGLAAAAATALRRRRSTGP